LSLLFVAVACALFFFCDRESKAAAGTVTSYEKVTWGISTGRYGVNGIPAFCAEYSKSWPTVGTTIDSIIESQNDILRKALYYGSNGPSNMLGNDARAHVLTAIAVSDANIGERNTGASAKYDEFYWDIVNNPSKYPSPPSTFHAYLAITSSSDMQNLAFYKMEAKGYVKAVKQSSDSLLTSGNSCYSLEGARYGLYSDRNVSETTRVGTLTMDASGHSNTVELAPGTYYAYELEAPKGYAKSTEIISFQIKSNETLLLQFEDIPHTQFIDLLLQKVDAETGKNVPQGAASLKGAQFQVCYYAGIWEEGVVPAKEGVTPAKTWVFETDDLGEIYFKDSYKISGDELYDSLPLGTITIQEIVPSEGYLLNDTMFIRQIKMKEALTVSTYSVPVVKEDPLKVEVTKYQTDTTITLSGVVFRHTKPDGTTEMVTTDVNGKVVLQGLSYGKHTLQEVATVEGYVLNEQIVEFIVDRNTKEHVQIDVYNDVIVLPKTGTSTRFLMTLAGFIFCVFGIQFYKKYKEKRRKYI